MIPVKLSLSNFLSYGEDVEALDFTSFHVACLSGNNGHGKSALLDAITWALWGEARKVSSDRKPDDGLLRIGATEMRVEFEFDLEGDRYRVIRSYRKTRRTSQSSLEFQVYDEHTEAYIPLSESSSVTKTQERIVQILRMDYETFINSAFILQGRADEFTRRSPRERKEILGEILGLRRYDELNRLARSHQQEAEQVCTRESARIEEIDAELERKEEYEEGIERANRELNELAEKIGAAEKALSDLQERRADLLSRRRQIKDLGAQIERLDHEIEETQREIATQRHNVDRYQKILDKRDEVQSAYERLQRLTSQESTYSRKERDLRRLEQERIPLEKAVQEARHQIEQDVKVLDAQRKTAEDMLREMEGIIKRREEIEGGYERLQQARKADERLEGEREQQEKLEEEARKVEQQVEKARSELQIRLSTLTNQMEDLRTRAEEQSEREKALQEARARVMEMEQQEKEQNEIRDQGTRLRTQLATAKTQIDAMKRENVEAERKLEILRSSPEARCPLCETDLDDVKRWNIETEFGRTIQENDAQLDALRTQFKTDREDRSRLLTRYQEIEEALKARPDTHRKLAEAEAAHQESLQAKARTDGLEQEIRTVEGRIEQGEFAREEQARLAAIRRQIGEIGYDRTTHRKTRRAIQELGHFEAERKEFSNASDRHRKTTEVLTEIREKLQVARSYLHDKRYAIKEQRELNDVLGQIKRLEYDPEVHQKIREELEKLGEVREQRERLKNAEDQIKDLKENLERLDARLKQRRASREELAARQTRLEKDVGDLEGMETEIRRQASERGDLLNTREKAIEARGVLQSQYEACLHHEEVRREVAESLEAAAKESRIYSALATAFGKEGIQALIIENAVPEIEEEANLLLSRLTNNRTQIAIESLRDLKTGGTRETLDIKISDELGERSYELYSGGEAFRTNFALRIALSKLLAKRAGTKLRTLVVDEGFGTQDAEGLDHLIGAIQAISEDFDKIIVVTHLEELKNAFPVRIEVRKLPEVGSRYEVIQ